MVEDGLHQYIQKLQALWYKLNGFMIFRNFHDLTCIHYRWMPRHLNSPSSCMMSTNYAEYPSTKCVGNHLSVDQFWMVHCGIWERHIVGFVNVVNCIVDVTNLYNGKVQHDEVRFQRKLGCYVFLEYILSCLICFGLQWIKPIKFYK